MDEQEQAGDTSGSGARVTHRSYWTCLRLMYTPKDAQAENGETSSLPTLSQRPTSPPKPQDQHRKPRGTKRASTEKAEPKKRRRKDDTEGKDSACEEEASKEESAATFKTKQRRLKRVDPEVEHPASGTEDISAESDFGDNALGAKVKLRKGNGNGNGTKESNPKQDGRELHSGTDEEEEDVQPTKSKRNGVKDREGRKNRIAEKLSSEEKAPRKPAAKAKARKRDSSSSVSPDPKEEEDITSTVQARISSSNDIGEQSQPESELSELVDGPPKAKQNPKSKAAEPETKRKPTKSKKPFDQPTEPDATKAEQSDSSMSILIDEPPKSKRNRKSGSAQPNPKTSKPSKTSKPPKPITALPDPDTEEIKRLQSQLIKCGIRKMWFKELSPYPTPKSKIKHLKEMLADAGMTGRFSEAKAEQIKEERELRADLEAVQEGEKKWGKVEEGGGGGRGKRGLAKGFEGLGFLNDDDGEETD